MTSTGGSAEDAIYTEENTYFESNTIPITTAATKSSMYLNSVDDILNSEADFLLMQKLIRKE
uniref:hypothetical protein n=1 Tax=Prevotella sp. TaxID=59823 RepID=UPI004027F4DE